MLIFSGQITITTEHEFNDAQLEEICDALNEAIEDAISFAEDNIEQKFGKEIADKLKIRGP